MNMDTQLHNNYQIYDKTDKKFCFKYSAEQYAHNHRTVSHKFIKPCFRLFGLTVPSFRLFGYIGLIFAMGLGIFLTAWYNLPYAIAILIVAVSISTFYLTALIGKVITGHERLVYHHHELMILLANVLLLWHLGQPLLEWLDSIILAIGVFLVFGRIGCLMMGCCHGKPFRHGVCYHRKHTEHGFPVYLEGISLFPTQAVESLYVLLIVITGVLMILNNFPAGSVVSWYIISYNLCRFYLELIRGDLDRSVWLGFSEAQWTALAMTGGVYLLELKGYLPYTAWHGLVALLLICNMFLLSLFRKITKSWLTNINETRKLHDLIRAIRHLIYTSSQSLFDKSIIHIEETSSGVLLSANKLNSPEHELIHFTFSVKTDELTDKETHRIADLITLLYFNIYPDSINQATLLTKNNLNHLLITNNNGLHSQ